MIPTATSEHYATTLDDDCDDASLRHGWVCAKRPVPVVPGLMKCPLPRRGAKEMDRNATIVLCYFKAWTGIHVVIVQRWQQGRDKMDSLFDGISSYYSFGFPVIFVLAPVVTVIKPMMPVALAVTLVLTGFACAYVAMSKANNNAERGSMLISAVFLALLNPWIGLGLTFLTTYALVDFNDTEKATNNNDG